MKVHGKRAMLNQPGYCSTAAIVAEIEDTSKRKKKPENDYELQPEVTLQVSDCYRSISFDFHFDEADDRKNDLHKVDVLIDALTAFREGLAIEQERYAESKKNKKA